MKGSTGTEYITKFQAATIQLLNKAASGDLKAIKETYRLEQSMPDFLPASCTPIHIHFIKPKPEQKRETVIEAYLLEKGTEEDKNG